jgi:hypothetical protein
MEGMVHSGHPEVDIWSSIADRRFRDLELGLGLDLLVFFASFERECGFCLAVNILFVIIGARKRSWR